MKLTFLGTRAWIEAANRRHRRHSALRVAYHGHRLMVDCGADWRGRLTDLQPDAIVLTHAHPDHAWGLADGFAGPVLATAEAWRDLTDYPLDDRRTLAPRTPVEFAGVTIEAFPVLHAIRAPTVALKLAGDATVLYAPDVVDIADRAAALAGVELYVGDGVSLTRSHARRAGGTLVGHTTVRAQLGRCAEAGVTRALFTHCGREIVEGDERSLGTELRRMGHERGVEAAFAHDGLEVELGG
jgi:phosphoribosyl 1,2-cyclic phosphodiesterase